MSDYESFKIGNWVSLSHYGDEGGQTPVKIKNIENAYYFLDQENAPPLTEEYMIGIVPTKAILENFGFQPAINDNESGKRFEKYFITDQGGTLVPGRLIVDFGGGLAASEVKLNNVDELKRFHTYFIHMIQNVFTEEYHLDILKP